MELKSIGMGAMSILAIAFSACSSNDDLEDFANTATDNNEIGFLVNTSDPTRAASSNSKTILPSAFCVSALDGNDIYFGESPDMVSRNANDSWTSSNHRCWPQNRPDAWKGLTFYACLDANSADSRSATAAAGFRISESGATFSDFEVDGDVSRQSDIMYAVAKDVRKSSFGGKVSLNFRHALSRVSFSVQNNHPLYDNIEILSIELGGVKGKATYFLPQHSTGEGVSDFYRNSDLSRGVWSLAKDAADCKYTVDNIGVNIGGPDASGKGRQTDLSGEVSMYLIPQRVEARASESATTGAYIKVTARLTPNYAPESPQISETFVPIAVDWKEGGAYNYNIVWNPVPITVSASVDDYSESHSGF